MMSFRTVWLAINTMIGVTSYKSGSFLACVQYFITFLLLLLTAIIPVHKNHSTEPMKYLLIEYSKLIIVFIGLLSIECVSLAATYSGQARFAFLSSEVVYSEPIQEETSNNVSIINMRLFLDGQDVFTRQDGIVLDIRDKYDSYGTANLSGLTLEPENSIVIRQAAYKKPWQRSRTFYTAGRFSVPEMGILSNDGAEYGYRLSRRLRVAGFVGIAPEDVVTPAAVEPDYRGFDGNQGGVYSVYQKENVGRMRTTYMVNGLAQAPSFELEEFVNRVYYYHQGLFNLGPNHRISSFLNLDVMPSFSPRQAYAYHTYYKPRYRIKSYASLITADDYRLKKDILDDLEPSTLLTVKSGGHYRFQRDLNFDGSLEYARRGDGLNKTEIEIGGTYRKLMKRRLVLGGHYGMINNYQSNDSYLKLSSTYYQNKYSVSANISMRTEAFDNGETLSPMIVLLDASYYPNSDLRGSFSYQMASAEDRSVNTAMLSVGYHFGSKSTSPTKSRAANFEDL